LNIVASLLLSLLPLLIVAVVEVVVVGVVAMVAVVHVVVVVACGVFVVAATVESVTSAHCRLLPVSFAILSKVAATIKYFSRAVGEPTGPTYFGVFRMVLEGKPYGRQTITRYDGMTLFQTKVRNSTGIRM